MARRGKEIALQIEIETQEEWEDMMSKEGLCVIDVYQEWGGFTNSMLGHFRKIKNELGDPLLKFVNAKADTIDSLEKYRGRCEPCFLFYAGGSLVAVIRGANAPLILRTITEQLAQEHKVLDGNAERKPIKDTMIEKLEARDREKEDEEEEQEGAPKRPKTGEPKKEVTVAIIKPDAVQSGQAEAIMEALKEQGIEVLRQEERVLTEDEVKNVYIHLQDEPFYEELVGYMTSSPSIVLAITKGKTGQNIINEFRELLGPTEVEQAKENNPDSLRAKFGSEKYMNAVHGSDSSDTAARELAFFFPDFVAPPVDGEPKLQRTLALIRPDAYRNHKDEIIQRIREAGFKIALQKEITLNKEQAEEFYKEHQGQEYFDELTNRMSSGPLLALGLAREDAVTGWREMLGPTLVDDAKEQQPDSLRAQFVEEGTKINMIHGSDSEDTAKKEIDYFFPMEQTVAVIKPDGFSTKEDIIEKIHDSGFRIAARKETTLSKEIAEEFYADHKDKPYYNDLVEHMVSGPTMFMVLSREDAVDGWRSLIGPTNPDDAKQADPDSLRGKFGTDILKNAVHGSSTKDHAMTTISKIFGDLYFNQDGTVREDKEEEDSGQTTEQTEQSEEHEQVQALMKGADAAQSAPKKQPAPAGGGVDNAVDNEAISEQQQINYETSPERGGDSGEAQTQDEQKKGGEPTEATTDEKEPSSVEQTEQSADTQSAEKSADNKSAEQSADTQSAEQSADTTGDQQKAEADSGEKQEGQEEKGEASDDKAPEVSGGEQTQEEQAPSEQKQEEKKPDEAQAEQEKPPTPEQKDEAPKQAEEPKEEQQKADEPKQEEAAPSEEQKQEEATPAEEKKEEEPAKDEQKPEESQQQQQEEKKEDDAKPEEKKED